MYSKIYILQGKCNNIKFIVAIKIHLKYFKRDISHLFQILVQICWYLNV